MECLISWQFTNFRAVNWRKMLQKITVCVPFDADLSILFHKKRTLELVRLAQLPRSCIIRQWLGFFWGCFIMNWSRLLPLFSSKESEPAERPGGGCSIWGTEVWKAFSRHPWLLDILIHYTFPNTLSIFVFHLQSVCELPMCFQTGNCFNWMDSWYLILMFCTKC